MLRGSISFNQNISNWNTSGVTDMRYMFAGADSFNQPIGTWDISNVTYISYMFNGTTSFNQNISGWNTNKVTSMSYMFAAATSFNQPIGTWDTSKVTSMLRMFKTAIAFNQNISAWNVSGVTEMTEMFDAVILSTSNYDSLLLGWSNRTEQSTVHFNAGNSKYSCNGIAGKVVLNTTYSWIITDGGLDTSVNCIPINITINCSSTANIVMWLNTYHEDPASLPLISSIDAEIEYWTTDRSVSNTVFLNSAGNSTYPICIENTTQQVNMELYAQYDVAGGYTHRYYIVNGSLNTSIAQNESLYNFNTTTGKSLMQLTVRDYFTNNFVSGIIVLLQRFYVSEGVWRTVQMFRTDDFGLALFNIIEQSVDYKLVFKDSNNNVLATTDSIAFSCTSGVCQLGYQLNQAVPVTPAPTLTITPVYDPATNSINITWTNLLSTSVTVNTTVITQSYTGSQVLCSELQTGTGGVVNCNTLGYSGPVLTTMIADGQSVLSQYIELNTTIIGAILDPNEGAFWAAMIILTCVGFGIMVSPAAGIIAIVIGTITVYVLGIFSAVTLTFVILTGLLAIAVGWRLRA
jgi:surface protein